MAEVIKDPPSNWVTRLRRQHKIWLVKQKHEATITFPYEPPEFGHKTGYLGVNNDSWFTDVNGYGIDGSLLILPIEGNFPENPPELPPVEIRHFRKEIEKINNRLTQLEYYIKLNVR